MGKTRAIITGVGGYVPDYVLNNEELSRMVETNDEWIMTRVASVSKICSLNPGLKPTTVLSIGRKIRVK